MADASVYFEHECTVFLNDTNMEGNMYWLSFLRWAGDAREAFLAKETVNPLALMEAGVRMITVDSYFKHEKPAFFLDECVVRVATSDIAQCSLRLQFEIWNSIKKERLCTGWQRIAFSDANGQLIRIPEIIRNSALRFAVAHEADPAERKVADAVM